MKPHLPLVHEIPYSDPVAYFAPFAAQPWSMLLDSASRNNPMGRYSYMAVAPFSTLNNSVVAGDPFSNLDRQLKRFKHNIIPELPPFQGGALGYFGYDLCHYLEKLPKPEIDDMGFADMAVGFYDLVMSFDHQQQRAWLFSSGFPFIELNERMRHASERCQWLLKQLPNPGASHNNNISKIVAPKIQSNFDRPSYLNAVQKVIDYIYAGDVFEVNISQRFKAHLPAGITPFHLYQRLRQINPAPFAAYLRTDTTVIASASPERFLRLQDGKVETRPIKGTRPRHKNPELSRQFANELINSAKDRAENIMIVDLMRNDLSRVCLDHSVTVNQLCMLESFATVHHLVSAVTATLKPGMGAVDLLRATFPGGSITGAPKVRAMEIIAELEPTRRGPYCGCFGYIGFDGAMDTAITIRTYAIKNQTVTFQAGGAIVADSDPAQEYQETLDKAKALVAALHDEIESKVTAF